jgi:TPR repeat protein
MNPPVLKFLRSSTLVLLLLTITCHAEPKPAAEPVKAPDAAELRKLADKGDAAAQFSLATLIFSGGAKMGKLEEAASLLEKSADAGHVPAQLAFARFLLSDTPGRKPDPERAKFVVQQAAESGSALGQTAYGLLLLGEVDLKARDVSFSAPVEWLKKAAEQNEPEALCRLGMLHFSGQGVPVDPAAGWKLVSKSAKLGFPLALNEAAVCLQNGRGVEQDAIGYYHAAADLGNLPAMVNLALCYEKGVGVPQNYANAGAAYARGAKLSFPMAQLGLARLFEGGLGTAKNPVYAYVNYARASVTIPEAATKRDELKKDLTKDQMAEAKKMLEEVPN